ncbi:MAG: hypothetical protein IT372_26880 [Polyangiaceae bacterium]|nr:hypothetical protein [Polyangiaceae bacterium]
MVSLEKRARRARERGAAVFIVVLVIAMLTAIGVFAASSASISTSSSGHERLATQTQYLTEYGVQLALAELERTKGWDRIDEALKRAEAQSQPTGCPGGVDRCWVLTRHDLELTSGTPLIDPPSASPTSPGSLGYADLDWDVRIELNKTRAVEVAGNSIVPDQRVTMTYCNISVNARGVVWPKAASNQDLVIAGSGSQSFLSGGVQVLCSAN